MATLMGMLCIYGDRTLPHYPLCRVSHEAGLETQIKLNNHSQMVINEHIEQNQQCSKKGRQAHFVY